MTLTPAHPARRSGRLPRGVARVGIWARRHAVGRRIAVALGAAALVSGIATFAALTGAAPFGPDPQWVLILLFFDLVLLMALSVMVVRRVVRIWASRRRGGGGWRLHVRLVVLFGLLAATPAILVAAFSVVLFNIGLQGWFNNTVRSAVSDSREVAEAYLSEHQKTVAADAGALALDLTRRWSEVTLSPERLNDYLETQSLTRNLGEIVLFNPAGRVIARAGFTFSMQFEEVPFWALERADAGDVAVLTGPSDDRVRALVRTDLPGALYLLVGRFVDPEVITHMERVQRMAANYERLEGRRSEIQVMFYLVFLVVALLLLFAAVWFGLMLATRLARPIDALIDAADRIRAGDLSVRVEAFNYADEVSVLTRAFNRMAGQISSQQDRLLAANQELDERRRFTEAVLAGVTAGVISLDSAGRIGMVNRSARDLLGAVLADAGGRRLRDVVPALAPIVERAGSSARDLIAQEVVLPRSDGSRTLLVRMAAERDGQGTLLGHVMTLDDITELQAAQRVAAWADVARRIAHEIKNPLTPIQLSAERLKRKYARQIEVDREVFESCTDTIVRHVGHIGRMVDEFSAFARMPRPVLAVQDLNQVVRDSMVLQNTAFHGVQIAVEPASLPVAVACDSGQIGQALTNLVKNAAESFEAVPTPARGARVTVSVAVGRLDATIAVRDNGPGLPVTERDRLTEPYVTTRPKGTGLGLAIVRKIAEDHGGRLVLENGASGGACVSLVLPLAGVRSAGDEQARDGVQAAEPPAAARQQQAERPAMVAGAGQGRGSG